MLDHAPGHDDRARDCQLLHARRDIYRLTKIVLATVLDDCEAWPFMNPYFEKEILPLMLFIKSQHRLAHLERRSDRPVKGRKCCHHPVTDGPHDCAALGSDDLSSDVEVRAN